MAYKIINPESILKSMMGNKEMVKQFVQMYLMQTPLDFENLRKSIELGDHSSIKDAAHHIKPTMEYIGASNLREEFQAIENLAKENSDLSVIKHKFEKMNPDFELLIQELQEFDQ